MESKKIKLKIGEFEVIPVPTGIFGLDGGAMFGTVPKVLWQKTNPTDEQNRIDLEARALLLKSPKRNVLIDSGNGGDFVLKYGEKLGNKFAEMYSVTGGVQALYSQIAKHGLKKEDITDVVLTHLHFDHAGGATTAENGKLVPSFPNAQYYVQKSNLENAQNPNIRERASYFAANFEAIVNSGKLTLLNGDSENIIPNISVIVSNGHTVGHQMVKVSDKQNTLIYCGDVIPTSTHVRLAWIMGYDISPLQIINEKKSLLEKASSQNWYLFFEHDPKFDLAQVIAQGSDFQCREYFNLQT